jgi:hypothetical protein
MTRYSHTTKKAPVTPDNVNISKIKHEVLVTPTHINCKSCSINKYPLKLLNPHIKLKKTS